MDQLPSSDEGYYTKRVTDPSLSAHVPPHNVRILIPAQQRIITDRLGNTIDPSTQLAYRRRLNYDPLDRRGSVDSGLAHVIQLKRQTTDNVYPQQLADGDFRQHRVVNLAARDTPSAGLRVVRIEPSGISGRPQVIHVGPSGRLRVVQQQPRVYRVVGQIPTGGTVEHRPQQVSYYPHVYQHTVDNNQQTGYQTTNQPTQVVFHGAGRTSDQPSCVVYRGTPDVYTGTLPGTPGGTPGCTPSQPSDQSPQVVYHGKPARWTLVQHGSNDDVTSQQYRMIPRTGSGDELNIPVSRSRHSMMPNSQSTAVSDQNDSPDDSQHASGRWACSSEQPSRTTDQSAASSRPSAVFTVRAVGQPNAGDFGQLIIESVRQFLAHKQRQQQQQQQQQNQSPWRQVTSQTPPAQLIDNPSSPSAGNSYTNDDRNLFQKYKFQFGSIDNCGNSNSQVNSHDDVSDLSTGSGSWNRKSETPRNRHSPVAVFQFQDFDDMVAKIRDHVTVEQQPVNAIADNSNSQQQQQHCSSQGAQSTCTDEDVDSGYNTSSRSLSTLHRTYKEQSPISLQPATDTSHGMFTSREQLRNRITAFNNNSQGFIISLDPNSDVFDGFIRVQMNLIRPVQMVAQPSTIYDALNHNATTLDHKDSKVTTFYLPKDTVKVIHITSKTSTKEVIRTLLSKFNIQDNPNKFALYEKFEGSTQQGSYMRRLPDSQLPLPLCLSWADRDIEDFHKTSFVLQENDTGEILWEAFSLPELENFLLILNKEEEEYMKQIRVTYRLLKVQLHRRLKDLRKDRIGPGAKLKPV